MQLSACNCYSVFEDSFLSQFYLCLLYISFLVVGVVFAFHIINFPQISVDTVRVHV